MKSGDAGFVELNARPEAFQRILHAVLEQQQVAQVGDEGGVLFVESDGPFLQVNRLLENKLVAATLKRSNFSFCPKINMHIFVTYKGDNSKLLISIILLVE